MTEFDVSDIHGLEEDMGKAVGDMLGKLRPVVQRGALTIKKDLQSEARGHPHFPHFPQAISYDTTETKSEVRAEIGPDKDKRQGALGNLLYFGSSKNPAVLDINGPLDREEPKFVKAVGDVIEDLL